MKKSKCKFCQKEFIKTNPLVPYCSLKCSNKKKQEKEKTDRKKKREKKREKESKLKERKEKKKERRDNSLPILHKKAEAGWKAFCRNRDHQQCVYCGSPDHLNVHHIFSRVNYGLRFEEENGITLCARHHTFSTSFSAHRCPCEFTEWLKDYMGEERYNALRMLAKRVIKKTDEEEKEYLRSKIEKFSIVKKSLK